jgi:ribosomal-protein-alanine N-acetyltransferase
MQKLKDPEERNDWKAYPADDLEIDLMNTADLPQVLRIENDSFISPWSEWHFRYEIRDNPLSYPFVLRKKESDHVQIVGFCVCWIINEELHINNIAVAPRFRKRGYGEILMRSAMEFGRSRECQRAALEVRVSNQSAFDLYKKLGFRVLGLAPQYYRDTREDAYILVKRL